jgi:hypothetical protein
MLFAGPSHSSIRARKLRAAPTQGSQATDTINSHSPPSLLPMASGSDLLLLCGTLPAHRVSWVIVPKRQVCKAAARALVLCSYFHKVNVICTYCPSSLPLLSFPNDNLCELNSFKQNSPGLASSCCCFASALLFNHRVFSAL